MIIVINTFLPQNLISQHQKNLFAARLTQVNLACKSDIANFVKKTDFDNKWIKVTIKKI